MNLYDSSDDDLSDAYGGNSDVSSSDGEGFEKMRRDFFEKDSDDEKEYEWTFKPGKLNLANLDMDDDLSVGSDNHFTHIRDGKSFKMPVKEDDEQSIGSAPEFKILEPNKELRGKTPLLRNNIDIGDYLGGGEDGLDYNDVAEDSFAGSGNRQPIKDAGEKDFVRMPNGERAMETGTGRERSRTIIRNALRARLQQRGGRQGVVREVNRGRVGHERNVGVARVSRSEGNAGVEPLPEPQAQPRTARRGREPRSGVVARQPQSSTQTAIQLRNVGEQAQRRNLQRQAFAEGRAMVVRNKAKAVEKTAKLQAIVKRSSGKKIAKAVGKAVKTKGIQKEKAKAVIARAVVKAVKKKRVTMAEPDWGGEERGGRMTESEAREIVSEGLQAKEKGYRRSPARSRERPPARARSAEPKSRAVSPEEDPRGSVARSAEDFEERADEIVSEKLHAYQKRTVGGVTIGGGLRNVNTRFEGKSIKKENIHSTPGLAKRVADALREAETDSETIQIAKLIRQRLRIDREGNSTVRKYSKKARGGAGGPIEE